VPALAVAACVAAAFVLAALLSALFRRIARRWSLAGDVSRRAVRPLRAVLVLVAAWTALRLWVADSTWTAGAEHALTIALILAVAWLVASIVLVVEDAIAASFRIDVPDNRHARRVRTQVQVVRRVTVSAVIVVAAAAILLTFPGMRTFGASMLASAGLLSIVAGLAAQSSLANVFAGMQLAFTDAIRVDDVVIVEGEWGKIEEITMTYVVVHIWDSRRMILPSTYFTSTPFQNWTRRDAELLGTVELDVDWTVPVEAMRTEMQRLLDATDLWDRRVSVLQVTDAKDGLVQVRALASAADAPILFDLRCYLREGLVAWLQARPGYTGIPRMRQQPLGALPPGIWTGYAEAAESGAGAPGEDAAAHAVPEAAGAAGPVPAEQGGPVPAEAGGPELAEQRGPGPEGAPVTRRSVRGSSPSAGPIDTSQAHARLFTGSIAAVERSKAFTGPDRSVIEEREQTAVQSGGSMAGIPRTPASADGGGTHGDQ
jgi:small-conductance mechanosensitive channel